PAAAAGRGCRRDPARTTLTGRGAARSTQYRTHAVVTEPPWQSVRRSVGPACVGSCALATAGGNCTTRSYEFAGGYSGAARRRAARGSVVSQLQPVEVLVPFL